MINNNAEDFIDENANNFQNFLPQNNNNDNNDNQIELYYTQKLLVPFISLSVTFRNHDQSNNPREEKFFQFIRNFFFPNLKLLSPITIILFIYIILFIICLFFGISKEKTFLTLNISTLNSFGMLSLEKLTTGNKFLQSYRWIMHLFLHVNFIHLLINCIILLLIGTFIEKVIKTYKLVILFFLSGIMGTIATIIISDKDIVGSSNTAYGLFGGFFGFYIINWKKLNFLISEWKKCFVLYVFTIVCLFGFLLLLLISYLSLFGQCASMIFGVIIYIATIKMRNLSFYMKVAKYISMIGVIIFTIFGIFYFYSR